MVAQMLAASYNTLLAEAAAGGFVDPPTGWTAGMILAHIALNDRRLAQITSAVSDGLTARNDNSDAIDDDRLREYAAGLGWDGLLREVRASADELLAAASEMTEEQSQRLVDTHIVDGGAVVVDDAVPWGRLLLVHAQNHVPDHTRQLVALRR